MRDKIFKIYKELLRKHGYQGWWPINGKCNPGDYSYPRNEEERFEIMIGAILTQNTSWKNVEKVLKILREKKLLDSRKILRIDNKN